MIFSKSKFNKPYSIGKRTIVIKPGENEITADIVKQLKKIPMFARNLEKGEFVINPGKDAPVEKKDPKKDDKKKGK